MSAIRKAFWKVNRALALTVGSLRNDDVARATEAAEMGVEGLDELDALLERLLEEMAEPRPIPRRSAPPARRPVGAPHDGSQCQAPSWAKRCQGPAETDWRPSWGTYRRPPGDDDAQVDVSELLAQQMWSHGR